MNKLKVCSLLLLLISLVANANAQSIFWNTKDAYLGQTPPSDTPKIFAKGILCDTGSWAGDRVAFSADGKEFYYGHAKNWFTSDNETIYFKYTDGKWTGPLLLTKHFYAPTFSVSGQ